MCDHYSLLIIKTIEALEKYVQEIGYWPSKTEWNKYSYQHRFYSADTLNYLYGWEKLRLKYITEHRLLEN
jgi:hypothetical protein